MGTRIGWWLGLCSALALGCDGGGDTSVAACDAEGLDGCEYASPGLTFTQRDAQATDEVTGRVLPLRIRVPDGDGPFPVVVYSHGGGLNDTGHVFGAQWGEALAAHGYVTVNIGHHSITIEQAQTFCTIGSIPESDCNLSVVDDDSGVIALVKRQDVIAVIDDLPALAAAAVAQGGAAVETDEVAVMGWSAGSRATMASRGLTFYPTPSSPPYSESDARIATIVALSPTGPGFGGFFADAQGSSWDTLDGPSLMATGENDVKPTNTALTGEIRREAYENQPADGTRRLLYSNLEVGVGGHGTYNLEDLGSSDERLDRLSRALRAAVRAHLDATLLGDAEAAAWLDTDDARVLAGDVDWVSK